VQGLGGLRWTPQRGKGFLCLLCTSLNRRITEWSGLEGTFASHLAQHPCRSRVTYSRLHRTLSRRVLNISREAESTASLGSLFQCSVTLRVKKFFLMFRWNFLCFNLCPLPLVLSLGTTEKNLIKVGKVCGKREHPSPGRHSWGKLLEPGGNVAEMEVGWSTA